MAELKARVPAMGFNTTVEIDGLIYQIQTEDVSSKSKVRTQILADECMVIYFEEYDYSKHLNNQNLGSNLIAVMRALHGKVSRRLQRGEIGTTKVLPDTPRPRVPSAPPLLRPSVQNSSVSGTRERTPSEVWDNLVKQANRRTSARIRPSQPPPNWDAIVAGLKIS